MSVDLFDDPGLDRALASGLSALAPDVEAVDVTLEELRPRFHRARTRRRVVQVSATIAALFVVGSLVVAQAPSVKRSHVTVESPARRTDTTHARRRTSTSERPHVSASVPARAPRNPAPALSAPAASAPARAPIVVSPATPPPTSPAVVPTPPSAPPTPAPASVVRRFDSAGGSITVRLSNRRLTLTAVRPAKGFDADVLARAPQLIEVRFTRNGREQSEIDVGLVRGQMVRVAGTGQSWTGRHLSAVSAPDHHASSHASDLTWAAGVSNSRLEDAQGEA